MTEPVIDKYKDKAIRFIDKGTYYELIFCDDFVSPTSGNFSSDSKPYTLLTDVIMDMKNANHSKEIHIFVASFGGQVEALAMILQQILEFRYRVGINLGMADSCGWMLLFACQERYASPFSEFLYHGMSSISFGKVHELRNVTNYYEKWFAEIMDRTDTKKVLTKEEIKLGETSEVWLTGAELIKRGAVKDYAEYVKRKVPTGTYCCKIDDKIYFSENGNDFILYQKNPKVKPLTYTEIVAEFNKKK